MEKLLWLAGRPKWAFCSRHPNFVNDCFCESEPSLGTTRFGGFRRFDRGSANGCSWRNGDHASDKTVVIAQAAVG